MGPDAIGPLLRRLRVAGDLTLEGLSALSGVSDRAISDIERGVVRGPQHRTVLAIARALDLPAAERGALVEAARAGRRTGSHGALPLPPVPDDVPDFTGRGRELATITAALTGSRPRPVVIAGAPGCGKTALAVRAASLLREAFPDQLFVDLGGTAPEPPGAGGVAVREVLERVPAGRRLLLVLDDAAAEAQVRALRPVATRVAVLVTSRRSLSGLEDVARLLPDRLPATDAERLLAAIIPAGRATGPDLVRLARLCDHVPLALRIAGNRVAARPGWTAAGLVARLAGRDRRLAGLTAGDVRMDTAIGASVEQLGPAARLLFRRLALVDEPLFGADTAAALVDAPRWRAEDLLDELADLHLVRFAGADRYSFRGLVRLYAEGELAVHEPFAAGGAGRVAAGEGPSSPFSRQPSAARLVLLQGTRA